MRRIEAIPGVNGLIIGRSYGGKSLSANARTGSVKIQRTQPGGLKAVTQSSKGLQELFILVEQGQEQAVTLAIDALNQR